MTIFSDLQSHADPKQAEILQRFFKTWEGQYGAWDIFLWLKVPVQRMIAKKYIDLDFGTLQEMLDATIHEYRLTALLVLVLRNAKADSLMKDQIFDFYIKNTKNINNWDLVDLTAPGIVGNYLLEKDKKLLYTFAKSKHLREKRIAIISTFAFLRVGEYEDTFKIAGILLTDTHDLIHKAVGWMLREVWKRSLFEEENFLKKHYKQMPRTMLRYAIEKFEESKRQAYLKGLI
jgi:3-methyladenine DNA glycosylase AlkD